ncbi:MAG: AAA family ATPase [Tannerellaceae bacterium]|nr:AAA family ATPase [Tannerellaceae bacterium]
MKILAIGGRNLASLEGDFLIDFTAEPLASTGIFAISGPTGVGKSTILDAMCLALFARTPRTDQAKENKVYVKDVNDEVLMQSDPRFLLRRGTATGYAQVDFFAMNGFRYRARWSVARARDKENGRLQQMRQTLYNLDKEQEEQGARSDIQSRIIDLIGLTFDQFTRSVLLAQNDFSTFLKAEQGEKAALLEKLTGTEHYSLISRRIYEKNSLAKAAYDKCSLQVQSVELLTEEEEQEIRTRLSEAEVRIGKLEKAKTDQQTLVEAVHSMEQLVSNKQQQQKEALGKLNQALDTSHKARKEFEESKQEQQEAEQYYQSIRQEIVQAGKLDVQIESVKGIVADVEKNWKAIVQEKQETEKRFRQLAERQEQGLTKVLQLKEWFEKYRSKETFAEQLSVLLLHLDAAYTVRETLNVSEKKLSTLKQQIEGIDKQIRSSQQLIQQKQQNPKRLEEQILLMEQQLKMSDVPAMEKSLNELRLKREQLLIEQAQFVTTGDIKALRDKLVENVPCPVCGSLQHPYASEEASERIMQLAKEIADITLIVKQLTEEITLCNSRQKQLQELQQKRFVLDKDLSVTRQEQVTLVNQQTRFSEQIAEENQRFADQSAALNKTLSEADKLLGNHSWQANWLKDPDTFRSKLVQFSNQWRENKETLLQLERQLSGWKSETASYQTFLDKVVRQEKEAQEVYTSRHKQWTALQNERKRLLGGRTVEVIEKEYQARLEKLKEKLELLQKVQAEQAGIVEQMRGVTKQITQDIEKASQDLAAHKATLAQWQQAYQEEAGEKTLEQNLKEVMARKSECQFRLRTHEENKKKVADLQDELNRLKQNSERWAKLNELAGSADGAKFRRIAQSYTLDVLLNYANVQLRSLTSRYRLERVPETLALQVIDRDMCDEIRTVHSLSGGESFLVSLALALGLSSLSSNRMKVESLFIDEGFGSLDSDTLRMAMDALESLRTQGRKIGVISHVQEMTERIPTQIQVCRASNGRSYIEIK